MARSPGIYYDPSVHDYGSKLVQGGLAGLAMGRNVQEIEMNKMKMDEAKKMQAVKDEIAGAFKDTVGTVKAPEAVSGAEAGFEPTQAGMAQAAEQGTQAEGQGLSGMLAQQASGEAKSKPLVAKAQFMTKAKEIFEKHGMVDQAMAIENNYMKHVGTIATTIGKKAAFKELQTGMLKDSFQDMTEADIADKGDHFKIEKVGPNNDGIVKFNKQSGAIEIVKEPTAKEEKDTAGGTTGIRHYKDKGMDITEEYDKATKTWKVKGKTAIKEGGAGGASGAGGKTTGVELTGAKGIIQQKYIDLAKEQARYENPDIDPEEIGKINTTNYYTYLSKEQKGTHDRSMIDAQEYLKKYPKEPAKAANEALKGVQGTQSKAAGKVSDESKGLIKGKYAKIVEDPKTKKRYGVKSDGTKEPL